MPAIQLLSHPALLLPGKPPLALATVDSLLLARLLLDGPQSPAALADWLWPDAGTARALSHLRQRRYRLKNLAGTPVVEGVSPLQVASGVTHDLLNFEAGLRANHNHGSGDLLGALQVPAHEEQAAWLQQRRVWWSAVKVAALQASLRALLELRCPTQQALDQALALAQRWVKEQPLNEAAWRSLMQLHHQRSEAALALQAYEDCKGLLLQQQHTKPSAETQRLAAMLQSATPPAAARLRPIPAALLRPPVLVERQLVWQQACAALASGQPVLLEGEAGVGKSRLLGDLVQSLGHGCIADAGAGDGVLAYAFVSLLVDRCVQRWGWPAEHDVQQQLARLTPRPANGRPDAASAAQTLPDTFNALHLQRTLTAALLGWHATGLAVVALDDLHHADGASMDLLTPVVAHTTGLGLRWLLAARPTPCDGTRALLGMEALQRLQVPTLTSGGVLQLLHSLALPLAEPEAWASALMQRTGGNPLYVLQTLSTALEARPEPEPLAGKTSSGRGGAHNTAALAPAHLPMPAPLLALVGQRLDRLGPTARALVRLAAVAGSHFNLRLAAAVLQQQPLELADPWVELLSAQIMRDSGFAHDLIQEAARNWTPPPIAMLLHEQIALALQQLRSPAAHVAPHWDAAACWPQAAQAYEQAAEGAGALGAVQDEVQKWKEAARCHRLAGTSGQAFTCEAQALRLMIANSVLDTDVQQACTALQHKAVGDAQQAQALEMLAHFHAEQFRPEEGLPMAEQALRLAQAAGDSATALRAAQHMGYALARLGRNAEAIELLWPLQDQASRLPMREGLAWRANLAVVLVYGQRWRQALQVSEGLIADAEHQHQWNVAADAYSHKAAALGYLGQLADSHAATEAALRCAKRSGAPAEALLVDSACAAANLRDMGCFAQYLEAAQSLPEALRQSGNPFWAQNAENDLAVAWAWLGRPERAQALLTVTAADLTPLALAMRWRTRARLAHSLGLRWPDLSPHQMALQAVDCLRGQDVPDMLRLSTSLSVALTGEATAGLAHAAEVETIALRFENMMLVVAALCTQMDVALRGQRPEAAAAAAQRLLQRWPVQELPAGPYPPEVGWLCHKALLGHDHRQAQEVLSATVAWVEQRLQTDVPPLYRDSFSQRNPVNAAVLQAAAKWQKPA